MAATRTSLAWQGFRRSNLVSTSSPAQARSGVDVDDSDEAEEDGFVGADTNGSEDMMMEIMDKYVEAGEALAEKENDVRQLTKQVDELRLVNSDLDTRVVQLRASNEKLADDEGRWYSLAKELENQMDVIKQGETYSLFQDKVDEAEARLEVATDSGDICKRRLYDLYGVLSDEVNDKDNDGGDEDVDEHRLHARVLAELHKLKASSAEMEAALSISQEASAAAEIEKQEELVEELQRLKKEAGSREEAVRSEHDALRNAAALQAEELRQAVEEASCAAEAERQASERAATAESSLERAMDDLESARTETQTLKGTLDEARAALRASERETQRVLETRSITDAKAEESADHLAETEGLLEQAQVRSAQLESTFKNAVIQVAELTRAVEEQQEMAMAATARADDGNAKLAAKEVDLERSLLRSAELEDALRSARLELQEKDADVSRAQSAAEAASLAASEAFARAEILRQEVEGARAEASSAQGYAGQVQSLREELDEVAKVRSSSQKFEGQVEELRAELERANVAAVVAEESAVELAAGLHQQLERANAIICALQKDAVDVAALRTELETAKHEASDLHEIAAQVQGLRHELDSANTAAVMAQGLLAEAGDVRHEFAAEVEVLRQRLESSGDEHASEAQVLRHDLRGAIAAMSLAEENAANSNNARIAAEGSAQAAENARAYAENQLEVLHQSLAANEADVVTPGADFLLMPTADTLFPSQDDSQATAASADPTAWEELRLAESRSSRAEEARDEALQEVARVVADVGSLEAMLAEARSSAQQLEAIGQQQREALDNSSRKNSELELSLAAAREQLEEKAAALAAAVEEAGTVDGSVASSLPSYTSRAATTSVKAPVDAFVGPAAQSHSASNGGTAHLSNGVATQGAEELQAHAEAMELELRYTLESFEGQLSAMAREKVAIQKQVKELTGQCSTLRKQVSHYKKVAKEGEAQLEQMLELQQQLCDAEIATENLRSAKSQLAAKVEKLEAEKVTASSRKQSQDEVLELRSQLSEAHELSMKKSRELNQKMEEAASAEARADDLEERVEQFQSELSTSRKATASAILTLTSAASCSNGLHSPRDDISQLEACAAELAGKVQALQNTIATRTLETERAKADVAEHDEAVRSLRDERGALLTAARQADEGQVAVIARVREIGALLRVEGADDEEQEMEMAVCTAAIREKLSVLTKRLATAEETLEGTAQALKADSFEERAELESGWSWMIGAINLLQRRLQLAEFKISESAEAARAEADGGADAAKTLEDLSVILECDHDRVMDKVNELKTLTHSLFQIRDDHRREIEQLKEDASTMTSTSPGRASMSHLFPTDDVAAAREEAATLQVTVDSLKHELGEVQQTRTKELEKHRREETKLQERHDALFTFMEARASQMEENAAGMRDRRGSSHRKSTSLHLDASSAAAAAWLAEQGHGARESGTYMNGDLKANGQAREVMFAGSPLVRTQSVGKETGYAASNGFTRVADDAVSDSAGAAGAVLAKVQALLGCAEEEVMTVLTEQQVTIAEDHATAKILGHVKHSYLNNMDSLASSIGPEAASEVSPLLARASELCGKGGCLTSNQEGLELLDEATIVLASLLRKSISRDPEAWELALRQAQDEAANLHETLRKERLMMMAFRRWGHFYLALSNEALRKRTRERNQSRGQRLATDGLSLSVTAQPQHFRGRARRSSSAGRASEREHLQLSSDAIQAMVEQEAETVARELADGPSLSLLALADARKEMDDMAVRAQATLGVLFSQPSQIQEEFKVSGMPPDEMLQIVQQSSVKVEEVDDATPVSSAVVDGSGPEPNAGVVLGADFSAHPAPAPSMVTIDQLQTENGDGDSDSKDIPYTNIKAEEASGPPTGEGIVAGKMGAPSPLLYNTPPVPTKAEGHNAESVNLMVTPPASSVSLPPPPPAMGLANGVDGVDDAGKARKNGAISGTNAPNGRAKGNLVEDGVSKADRAEFLRKQREERKANRKKGNNASTSRTSPPDYTGTAGLRNRRTSAPGMISSSMSGAPSGFAPTRTPAPVAAQASLTDGERVPSPPPPSTSTDVTDAADVSRAPSQALPTGEPQDGGMPPSPPEQAGAPSDGETPAEATVLAPPPRMFNPTSVPPPIAAPPVAASAQALTARHPSMAFNVNETVERALTQAKQEARVSERRAIFWKCRFRDLAAWSVWFAVFSFAADHSFEDC